MKSDKSTTDYSFHHYQPDRRDQATMSTIGNSSHSLPNPLNHSAAADSIPSVGNDTSVWFRQPRPLARTASSSSHHTSASATTVPSEASSDGRNTSHTIVDPTHMSVMEQKVQDEEEGDVASPISSSSSSSQAEFRTYPIAWVALFFLVILRSAVSIFQNTFNPIPNVIASYLNVNLTAINWLYNIMSIVYIVISFGTGWAFETLGVKKSLIVAGILTAAGCWIRWVAVKINPPSYAVMMIGQVIASIGSPLTLNIMTKFATVWFTENRRATAGMFVASNYGGIIAMFLMPAVATGESKIEFTLILVAAICTAALVPHIFLPAKPPAPPSLDLQSHRSQDKVSVLQSTVVLFKNVHFWILCGIHGLNIGLSIAWGGLTNQAITPYGYSDAESGNIVAVGIFAGTLGCFVAGPMLDATKRHKLFLKMMAPFMCSTYVALVFVVSRDSFAAILYVNALNQFFLAFMIPVVIELGVEATYPVPESISTSVLWQAAQIIGFILVLVMDKFRNPNGDPPNNMFRALIFQAAIAGFCVVLAFIYNGPMLRTQAYEEATAAMHLKREKDIRSSTTPADRPHRMRHRYQNSSETIRVIGNPDEFEKTA